LESSAAPEKYNYSGALVDSAKRAIAGLWPKGEGRRRRDARACPI